MEGGEEEWQAGDNNKNVQIWEHFKLKQNEKLYVVSTVKLN